MKAILHQWSNNWSRIYNNCKYTFNKYWRMNETKIWFFQNDNSNGQALGQKRKYKLAKLEMKRWTLQQILMKKLSCWKILWKPIFQKSRQLFLKREISRYMWLTKFYQENIKYWNRSLISKYIWAWSFTNEFVYLYR